jgi:hypothetical protein
MGDGKKLRFEMVLDEPSFQKVKRAVQDLTNEFAKMGKAMGGGGGGLFSGANIGKPPTAGGTATGNTAKSAAGGTGIAQAILKDVDAFQQLAKKGGTSLTAMSDAVKRAADAQSASLDKIDKKIQLITSRYASLNSTQAAHAQLSLMNLQQQRNGGQANLNALQGQMRSMGMSGTFQNATGMGLINFNPSTGPFAGGGAINNGLNAMSNFVGGIPLAPTTGIGWLGAAGLALGGVSAIANTYTAANNMAGNLQRGSVSASMSEVQRRAALDVRKDVMFNKVMESDKTREREFWTAVTGKVALARQGVGAVAGVGGGLFNAIGLSGVSKFFGGSGEEDLTGSQFTDKGWDTNVKKRFNEERDKAAAEASPLFQLAYDQIQDSRSSRRMHSRMLGGGYNKDKHGDFNGSVDKYISFQNKLLDAGLDESEFYGGLQQSRQLGLRGNFASGIASATAAGYSGYGAVLAGAVRGSGNASRGHDLAGSVFGNKIDTQTAINLGGAVFGSGYDVRGTTDGAGLLAAVQNGYDYKNMGFNEVQQAQAGIGMLDATLGGQTSGYQRGRNLMSAISLNGGGSTYSQDYLANGMSFKQMADMIHSGKVSGMAESMGLTPEMLKAQIAGSTSASLDTFVDQKGVNDPMQRVMRKYRNSGKSLKSFSEDLKGQGLDGIAELKALGDAVAVSSGRSSDEGRGEIALLSGMDGKLLTGRAPGVGVDDEQKARNKAEKEKNIEVGKQVAEALKSTLEEYQKNLGKMQSENNLTNGTVNITDAMINISGSVSIDTGSKPNSMEQAAVKAAAEKRRDRQDMK